MGIPFLDFVRRVHDILGFDDLDSGLAPFFGLSVSRFCQDCKIQHFGDHHNKVISGKSAELRHRILAADQWCISYKNVLDPGKTSLRFPSTSDSGYCRPLLVTRVFGARECVGQRRVALLELVVVSMSGLL